jgi:hypothetical protein
MLRARERALTPFPFVVFSFGFAIESIKELGDASQAMDLMHPKLLDKLKCESKGENNKRSKS